MDRLQLALLLALAVPASAQESLSAFEDGRTAGARAAAEAHSPWGNIALAVVGGLAGGGATAYWSKDASVPTTDAYIYGGAGLLGGIIFSGYGADAAESSLAEMDDQYRAGFTEGYREATLDRRMVTALVSGAVLAGSWLLGSHLMYDEARAADRRRGNGSITIQFARGSIPLGWR